MLLFYTCTVVLIIKARDESQTVYSAVFLFNRRFWEEKEYVKIKKITRVRICPF